MLQGQTSMRGPAPGVIAWVWLFWRRPASSPSSFALTWQSTGQARPTPFQPQVTAAFGKDNQLQVGVRLPFPQERGNDPSGRSGR